MVDEAENLSSSGNSEEIIPVASMEASSGESKGCGCKNTAGPSFKESYIYALGAVDFRFPNEGIEKEYLQAVGRMEGTANLTDVEVFAKFISDPNNRYISRQLCWVFVISNLETYILRPRSESDIDLLTRALGNRKGSFSQTLAEQPFADLIIGVRGPFASPETCNGLVVPIVTTDQVYSFTIEELIKNIPRPKKISAQAFPPIAREVFSRGILAANNIGSSDEHRAINYLLVRFPGVYEKAAELYADNFRLYTIEGRSSKASVGRRKIVDVVFTFVNRTSTYVEKYAVPVDVTDEFPFVVQLMRPYIE